MVPVCGDDQVIGVRDVEVIVVGLRLARHRSQASRECSYQIFFLEAVRQRKRLAPSTDEENVIRVLEKLGDFRGVLMFRGSRPRRRAGGT